MIASAAGPMRIPLSSSRSSARRLAPVALLLASVGALGCGEDDPAPASNVGTTACESKAYCYEVVGGLSKGDQEICKTQGSQLLAACDPTKAVRKCTETTKSPQADGTEKELKKIYFYRDGDTTGCKGIEERLN